MLISRLNFNILFQETKNFLEIEVKEKANAYVGVIGCL